MTPHGARADSLKAREGVPKGKGATLNTIRETVQLKNSAGIGNGVPAPGAILADSNTATDFRPRFRSQIYRCVWWRKSRVKHSGQGSAMARDAYTATNSLPSQSIARYCLVRISNKASAWTMIATETTPQEWERSVFGLTLLWTRKEMRTTKCHICLQRLEQ